MNRLLDILSFLIALTISATCSEVRAENVPVIYEDFTEAYWLHVTSPGTFVFEDNDSWYSFCSSYWDNNIFWPEIDFEKYMLIAIFWGQSGGCNRWANCVRDVFIRDGVIEVHLIQPELGYCDMIIWPLQVIKMKRYNLPVEFKGYVPGDTD